MSHTTVIHITVASQTKPLLFAEIYAAVQVNDYFLVQTEEAVMYTNLLSGNYQLSFGSGEKYPLIEILLPDNAIVLGITALRQVSSSERSRNVNHMHLHFKKILIY